MVQTPKRIRLNHAWYADPEASFHVVFHAAIGERPFETRSVGDGIWQMLLNERERGSVELLAACLMPDHLHALVAPRNRDIIRWVDGFKSYSTRLAQRFRPQRILWQPGFYDHLVRGTADFENVVAYILQNPVAANLAVDGEWPWVGSWLEG